MNPLVPSAVDDIRDIRAPWVIPTWWWWPLAVGGAVLAALAVGLGVRWWRSHHDHQLTPLERARRALKHAEAHAREGRSREWACVVAHTLREALAVRVGADVLPQTTSELAKAPWAESPDAAEENGAVNAKEVLAILQTCDFTRFALAEIQTDALLQETQRAQRWVESLFAPPRARSPKPPQSRPLAPVTS